VPDVHPAAVVEPGARLDPTASVGPCAVIGSRVTLGPGCRVEAHAVIQGETTLGPGNHVGVHAVLGAAPQIRGRTVEGALQIGEGNTFRELVTVHVGGARGSVTRIGNQNLLMAYSHVAHDCCLGDGVELANGVQLAGHVQVEDHAVLGGLAAVHQFVRIGTLAFVGAGSMVSQDVPPFTLASGDRARIYDLNVVGLRRHGYGPNARRALRRALGLLLTAPTIQQGVERVRAGSELTAEVERLLAFVEQGGRGLCRPTSSRAGRYGAKVR